MLAKWESTHTDKAFFALLCIYLAVLGLTGGASRADEPGQIVVVVAAAIVLLVAGAGLAVGDWRQLGAVHLFVLAAFALVLVQLIPLPPGLWTRLPGRPVFAEAMTGADIEIGWHALSLTPDATLFAVLAFAPLFAVLALMLRLSGPFRALVPGALLVLIAAGALLAMVQVATGTPYFYRIANFGEATGSFANRNHFALFTALSLPLLAVWAVSPPREGGAVQLRPILAGVAAITVVALLLVAGSRGGLLVGLVGCLLGLLIWSARSGRVRRGRLLLGAAVGLAVAVLLTAVFSAQSRDLALARIVASEDDGIRANINRAILPMIGDYLPFGSGFGSFASVYKLYEPLETLGPRYANQAHNDLLQIVLEGGLPALALLAAFGVWFLQRSLRVWRGLEGGPTARSSRGYAAFAPQTLQLGQAGSAMIVMIGIMSAFDYPLRTPLVATVFVLAMAWLEAGAMARKS